MDIFTVLVWYIVGVCSFVWWWTQDYNLTTKDIPFMLFVGLFGPVTWVMGWGIHSQPFKGIGNILLRKRD